VSNKSAGASQKDQPASKSASKKLNPSKNASKTTSKSKAVEDIIAKEDSDKN